MKIIFDEADYESGDSEILDEEFNELFNNRHENKKYVVSGYLDLWDGIHKGHMPHVYSSLKEAIVNCEDGFGICTSEIVEGKYGRLYVITHHHDSVRGGNKLEIRELSKMGETMYDCGHSVESILNRKGATRNVKFCKNYF